MKTKNAQTTPGPWNSFTIEGYKGPVYPNGLKPDLNAYVGMPDGRTVTVQNIEGEKAVADARLIAASPDLLSACRKALDYLGRIDEGSEGCELRGSLRAAIAKVEGRE